MRLVDVDGFMLDYCHTCDGWCKDLECDCLNCKKDECRCYLMAELAYAPTIDAEPVRHGRWVKKGQSFLFPERFMNYSCSLCGYDIDKTKHRYCPNCGAKMDEVKE